MGELTTIGFTPGRSQIHRLDPRTKQALLMVIAAVSLWGQWFFLIAFSSLILVSLAAAGISVGRLIGEIRYFFLFLLFVFLVRSVGIADGWMPTIAADTVQASLIVCWRLLLVVLMGILVMATTRTAHIRAALVWFLKPVPWVDEKMAATMVGLVVRFLPVILYQAAEINDAQRARGIDNRKNPMVRLKRFSIPLLRRVFLYADELTVAMQARCYNENRTLPDLAFTRHDVIAIGIALGLSLTVWLP